MAQASALRNQVGQLLAAIRVLAHLRRQESDAEIAEIEGCFNATITSVSDSKRLDRVLLRHKSILETGCKEKPEKIQKTKGNAENGGIAAPKRRSPKEGPPPSENRSPPHSPPKHSPPRTPLGQITSNSISSSFP
jgi:hypothetical protein